MNIWCRQSLSICIPNSAACSVFMVAQFSPLICLLCTLCCSKSTGWCCYGNAASQQRWRSWCRGEEKNQLAKERKVCSPRKINQASCANRKGRWVKKIKKTFCLRRCSPVDLLVIGLWFLCRAAYVGRYSHHPGGAVCGGHILVPGPALGPGLHTHLHTVFCEILYHWCDRSGGGCSRRPATCRNYLPSILRQGKFC